VGGSVWDLANPRGGPSGFYLAAPAGFRFTRSCQCHSVRLFSTLFPPLGLLNKDPMAIGTTRLKNDPQLITSVSPPPNFNFTSPRWSFLHWFSPLCSERWRSAAQTSHHLGLAAFQRLGFFVLDHRELIDYHAAGDGSAGNARMTSRM
jgi:hypothetical protein